MVKLKPGDHVGWKWLNGVAEGIVEEVVYDRISITSKGKKVVRNGTRENPAIVISHKSGNPVIKLYSEVQLTK
jgi:hypothetical protein